MRNIPRPYELMSAMIWRGRRKTAETLGHLPLAWISSSKKLKRMKKKAKLEKTLKLILTPPPMSRKCERSDDVSSLSWPTYIQ